MPDRHHVLVDVLRLLDDVLLARRLALRDLDRLERMAERIGELPHAFGIVVPAEHLVDDLHVAEQIGDDAVVGLALDVLKQDRTAAVHVLLQAGDLEVGIDGLVGLDQVALPAQPVEGGTQIGRVMRLARGGLFLAQCFLHGASSDQVRRESAPATVSSSVAEIQSRPPRRLLLLGAAEVPLHRFLSIMCTVDEILSTLAGVAALEREAAWHRAAATSAERWMASNFRSPRARAFSCATPTARFSASWRSVSRLTASPAASGTSCAFCGPRTACRSASYPRASAPWSRPR